MAEPELTTDDVRRLVHGAEVFDVVHDRNMLAVLVDIGGRSSPDAVLRFRRRPEGWTLMRRSEGRAPSIGFGYTDTDCRAVELSDGRLVAPRDATVGWIRGLPGIGTWSVRWLHVDGGPRPPIAPDTPMTAAYLADLLVEQWRGVGRELTDRDLWVGDVMYEWPDDVKEAFLSHLIDRLTGDPQTDRDVLDGPLADVLADWRPLGRHGAVLEAAIAGRPELVPSLRSWPPLLSDQVLWHDLVGTAEE